MIVFIDTDTMELVSLTLSELLPDDSGDYINKDSIYFISYLCSDDDIHVDSSIHNEENHESNCDMTHWLP